MNVKCPKCKTLLGTPKSNKLHIIMCPCGQKLRVKAPQAAAKEKPTPKNQRYMVTKSWFGKPVIKFRCPECDVKLSDSLKNAGAFEKCPECFVLLLTPGIDEKHAHDKKLEKEKEEKKYKKALAAKERAEAGLTPAPKNNSVSQAKDDGCMTCGCLVMSVLAFALVLLIVFIPRDEKASSTIDKKKLAAIQAEVDLENEKAEAKLEAIRQKVKQVEEYADSNKLVGLTDLAVIEARGIKSGNIDFNLQEARDLCRRNYGFLENEQDFQQLRQDLDGFSYDDESALTVFQAMYGVTNENAEAACTEWIATKSQPDWNLNEVMAICLRNKSEGIKTGNAAGSFKVQAARVIQRELESLQQFQEESRADSYGSGSSSTGSSYKDDIDKIIEAKAKVRSMLNYPGTASFHNLETKVSGNVVTLTVTAENAFGTPETTTFTIRVD